jgi:hypothetical protein
MYNNTTDGSFDNEAVKIANAFKPFWKKWMKEWGRNCVRSKKMTVTTAPSILTGLIGVTDAFSDTECMIPFQNKVANAQVGDTVWVKWMYDNQQTMYAENMGDVRSEKVIISGVKNAEPVPSGGSVSYSISFEKPFKDTPVVVASMISPHSIETGLCSVRIWDVSPFSFTVGYQNGSQYSRNIGASWIATGELLNSQIQYITDTTPYLNRAIPYSSNYLNLNKIIGGTVCWNQLLQKLETGKWSVSGADSYTLSDGVATVHKNSSTGGQISISLGSGYRQTSVSGHKYLFTYTVQTMNGRFNLTPTSSTADGAAGYKTFPQRTKTSYIWNCAVNKSISCVLRGYTGANVTSEIDITVEDIQCFDLTQMFGSTIADYIYSLEQAEAGAGATWFESLFTKTWYPFDAGALLSVKTSAHVMRDENDNIIGDYALDSNLELRGILKLDASNNLYYDGDVYESDGTVTRRYGIVDLGALNWTLNSSYTHKTFYSDYLRNNNLVYTTTASVETAICPKYVQLIGNVNASTVGNNTTDKIFCIASSGSVGRIAFADDSYSDATAFKSAMDGVYLVYELATPTTETATSYTQTQTCDPNGTEEFIDGRTVEMPVGNETQYIVM